MPDGFTTASRPQLEAVVVGETIAGKYRVDRILGEGGMGVVVAVTHLQLGERYALKFLHGDAISPHARVRFLREAQATVRLKSEFIVHVSDVGELENGSPYIVMEHLIGDDLGGVIRNGPLQVADAVDYVLQACAGIGEAHANGIIHRDLKPSNLFLTTRSDGSSLVKVLDFGISKLEKPTRDSPSLTDTHEVFGSPAYMPPEQIRSAKSVDYRADVWALGVILHELLTGELPFEGETSAALLAAIAADVPRAVRSRRLDVSPELDAIVRRCLEKKPADRFSSVAELALALAPFGSQETSMLAGRIARRASVVPPAITTPRSSSAISLPTAFATTEKRVAEPEPKPKPKYGRAIGIGAGAVATVLALIFVRARIERPDESVAPQPTMVALPPTPSAPATLDAGVSPNIAATAVTSAAPTASPPASTPAAPRPGVRRPVAAPKPAVSPSSLAMPPPSAAGPSAPVSPSPPPDGPLDTSH
ncbi:MAG: protein kinase [Labilithrix sp.]|nr:protein kinase [Labilithrix sp.]